MMVNLLVLGCGVWGIWHFGQATYRSFKHRYVMWSYSRASDGSRIYEADDPKRFRIGAWINIAGLAGMIVAVALVALKLIL